MKMYKHKKVDMTAFGQAVKEAREKSGLTREKLAEILDLSPRYLMYIETRGQHTSLQKLYEIATYFSISIDQFFFTDRSVSKSTSRRQLEALLDGMDEKDLSVIAAMVSAMRQAKKTKE
jgi:transcriptional regulator with XRE-family HTH domain